jgi:hypothetical protein
MNRTKENPLPWRERVLVDEKTATAVISTGKMSLEWLVDHKKVRKVKIGGRVGYAVDDLKKVVEALAA